jgi:two-component system sensor histidine kinase PilS (NtrC family)
MQRPMRPTPRVVRANVQANVQAMLDPRRLLRLIYIGRLSITVAIFLAAVLVWTRDEFDNTKLLILSLAFGLTTAVTVASVAYTEIYKRQLRKDFLYLQAVSDLILVTAVVHVTQGPSSPFAALYILVIAAATLLLPIGGGLLIAGLGNAMYVADVLFMTVGTDPGSTVWLQLAVFTSVALGSGYLSVLLRREGEGKAEVVAELRQLQSQADEILRNIRSGVITVDPDGRLLYANPMAEQMLELQLLERVGHPVVDQIAEVAPELADAVRRSIANRERTTRAEGTVTTATRTFSVGVATTYTEGDGLRTNRTTTAIFQDISDAKRMEGLRLRAERLEGIAELSAALAHEIKNPLASIRSAIEQLSRVPRATKDERTLSTLVMRESDRLARLLTDFLDFARLGTARAESVNVGDVVQGAVSLVSSHPDCHAGLRVRCVVPKGKALTVEGDEDLLHRAIFNLTLNAVQASPADGEVRVDAEFLDGEPFAVGFEPGSVAIRVTDQGAGIARAIRDRLFDPFFTTKTGGSGLGLAVVHRAIEAHRGLVFFDSAGPRGGTRFTVILPRTRAGGRAATRATT